MSSNYDVVVVGAGCAGLTAAIGLARSGFAVAVVEAAKTRGQSGLERGAESSLGTFHFRSHTELETAAIDAGTQSSL